MKRDLELKTSCGTTVTLSYELPDSMWADVFVPPAGVCRMAVDVSAESMSYVDLVGPDGQTYGVHTGTLAESAVLEQAGDVCALFLEALPIEVSACDRAPDETEADWLERRRLIESSWMASVRPSDLKTLTDIADMALHESDAHTAWLRLPDNLRWSVHEPAHGVDGSAHKVLMGFIEETLVERAQDMATAAAKRRQAQWRHDKVTEAREIHASRSMDTAIKAAKAEGL